MGDGTIVVEVTVTVFSLFFLLLKERRWYSDSVRQIRVVSSQIG
jgi:hypothetical protein